MLPTPKKFKLVCGAGEGTTQLNAFDEALLVSELGNLNLLKVSSILPPKAELCEDLYIAPGSLVPTAYGTISSAKEGQTIAAAVAVGIPLNPDSFGVIMECSILGTKDEISNTIKAMVIEAFEMRKLELKEIKIAAIEHKVKKCGSVFAGLALWY